MRDYKCQDNDFAGKLAKYWLHSFQTTGILKS